jgi:hypothetical protein
MLHFNITIFRTTMWRHFLWLTKISRIAVDVASLESRRGSSVRDLTQCPWTSEDRFYAVTIIWIFLCFPAHSALHTADRFRAVVLFNFAFSRYTEPSPVSTDYYFCCFVLWTHRLHREMMLWVKEWNKVVMTITVTHNVLLSEHTGTDRHSTICYVRSLCTILM